MRTKSGSSSINGVTELLVRALCDVRPNYPSDGAYLYCQTQSNQQSLFHTARFLVENSFTTKILILQTEAKGGFPGFNEWKPQLQAAGITEEQIEGVEAGQLSLLNTLVESEALIRSAKKMGYNSLFVIAPPFQQLRAFMTAATVVLREYPELKLYSYPAQAMSWHEFVVHSQGTLMATRKDLIHSEFDRIARYQKKGDLASYKEVLQYLDARQDES